MSFFSFTTCPPHVRTCVTPPPLNRKDSAVGAGDIVSNDERDVRRWRLGQLGFVTEAALWMLVVNTVAHEEGGVYGGGDAAVPSPAERRLLYDELLELFDTRLDEHAPLWENLVSRV